MQERRLCPRRRVFKSGSVVRSGNGAAIECAVRNVSDAGALSSNFRSLQSVDGFYFRHGQGAPFQPRGVENQRSIGHRVHIEMQAVPFSRHGFWKGSGVEMALLCGGGCFS
jgi:hypothetical protein